MTTKTESELASPSPAQWPEDVVERACDAYYAAQKFPPFRTIRPEDKALAMNAMRAALATPPTPEDERTIDQMWQEILDKDDRNSPEEYPEMVLLTYDEFKGYLSAYRRVPASPEDERVKGLVSALEKARHGLVCSDNLRATDLSREKFAEKLAAGVRQDEIEWRTSNTAEIEAIDAALASYRGGA